MTSSTKLISPGALDPPKKSGVAGTVMLGAFMSLVLFILSRPLKGMNAYSWFGAIVLVPFLIAITLPVIKREAEHDGDPTLARFLIIALIVKLIGAYLRYKLTLDLYGRGDALIYHDNAVVLSDQFLHGRFDMSAIPEIQRSGTYFVSVLTGGAYTLFGASIVAGYMFFSWLGFLGMLFFYRAFKIGVPEGRARSYSRFLFLLPSMVFWPSSIGKESWMTLCLGMAALGAAYLFTNRVGKGIVLIGAGLGLAANPRPHVAGIAAIAIAAGYLLRRSGTNVRRVGLVAKVFGFVALGLIAGFMVTRGISFVEDSVNTTGGLNDLLGAVQDRTAIGDSSFKTTLLSPAGLPKAVFTVLYRPTAIEAGSAQGAVAALENTFLLLFTIVRFRWLIAAVKLSRQRPYLLFAAAHVGLLIIGFSTVSNLGLLSRERVQLTPLFLALFMIPPKGWVDRKARSTIVAPAPQSGDVYR